MTAFLFRMFAILALLAAPLGMAAPASAMPSPVAASADHCADQHAPSKKSSKSDCCDDCAISCSVFCSAVTPVDHAAIGGHLAVVPLTHGVTVASSHEADQPPFEPPPPRAA